VPPEAIARPEHRVAVFSVTARLLDEAERYYASAQVGLARLPFRSAWAVATAHRVYRDIGRLVRERGAAAWDRRASTGRARKVLMAVAAAGDAITTRRGEPAVSRDGLWTRPR
jgi:phytoene synthase